MNDLYLTKPNKNYQSSFENYALAYQKVNDTYYFEKYEKALHDFDWYIQDLDDQSRGINIPQDWVATSTFWLIDKDIVVGVVRIRHQEVESAGHIGYDISPCFRGRGYGTQILKLAIKEAKKIGVEEVIVTCNTENTASRKIIEKNNGKLLGTIYDDEEKEFLYKYKIDRNN
ncbi:GNAT family N-acetyltransferase [Sporolactobacillus laevolacticus]|uniref:GCN5 family acetyltransferase n=1 Tax=Sporolactobacillus laevolacticus DSM 442 TaxID=1395513 RepID=V6IXM2_9BACL|nr:GNAT family N-acetyltransferase [Sporolactobacillus laevolacticus]EST12107.1 GCN5 family acetyltransferase [Sporolactobacillus laevolacticus DSM 442]